MGGEGRNLGPGKVQTSNVLQNMECVEFFPLGYVGFCLCVLGGVFLSSSLLSLASRCIKIVFLNLFSTSYSRESRAKKTLNSLWFTVIGGVTK